MPERGRRLAWPCQNGTDESFNGKFRDECLDMEWVRSRAEAVVVLETWSQHYDEVRPHSSLGYLTPNEFTKSLKKSDRSEPDQPGGDGFCNDGLGRVHCRRMTYARFSLAGRFALALALFVPDAASADAKDPPVIVEPVPVPVEPVPASGPVPVAEPAPMAAPAPLAQPARRGPRARFALELGIGAARGNTEGGALSVDLQLGYQGNDLWALYYQTGLSLNGWAGEGDSVEAYAFWTQLAMFDLTLGRVLQIGVGAGVDIGSFGICDANDCRMQDREAQPATEARLALIVPLPGLRARWGIPVSLRWHTTHFAESTMHTVTLNAGLMRY